MADCLLENVNNFPIHIGPLFKCHYCLMMYISEDFLIKHQKKCENLKFISILKIKLKEMNKKSEDISKKQQDYYCNECFSGFLNLSEYQGHFLDCHSEKGPFQCDQNSTIKGHCMKTHSTNDTTMSLTCPHCSETFKQKDLLTSHLFKSHSNVKSYACEKCPLSFLRKSHFIKHLRLHTDVHIDETRPHSCTFCPWKFKRIRDLKNHIKRHTRDKTFECTKCQQKFYSKSELKKHLQTHSPDQRFSCTKCSAKFSFKSFLNKHLLMHTSSKPFQCHKCPFRFSQQAYLDDHLRTHTD